MSEGIFMNKANLDPIEINKFSNHANEWWKTDGPYQTLHHINPTRIAFIKQQSCLHQTKVLDIGCGGGLLAEGMAHAGATVTGIDMDKVAIKTAQQHADENKLEINYLASTAEDFASKHPAEFDTVTCLEMLEHVPNPASIIQACSQLVKPGGNIFFSTLNRNPLSYVGAILGAEYLLQMLPKGTHQYARFIKPSELDNWARSVGLQQQRIAGLMYNPFNKNSHLSSNTSINYIAHYRLNN